MSASSYGAALARVLAHEGGYTNDPRDPGGPTNHGITIADYRRYAKPDATAADVRAMSVDAAKAIYRTHYWDALACDALPAGLDYAVFDYGVNSGVARAAKALQRLVSVEADGAIGPATLAAVARRDPVALIAALCDERLAFLKSLKTWAAFGNGWSRRVADVRAAALQMAAAAPPAPQPAAPRAAVAAAAAGPAVPAAGFALHDLIEGNTMLMISTVALALVAAALLYVFLVRPALPHLAAGLKGLRTIIAARLVTLCGVLVGLHDFLMPYVAGVDWTPFTARVPAWTVPLILVATGALFEALRRVTRTPVAGKA